MTCDEFQGRMSAYMDGEISRWGRWKVQTHLRFCPECSGLMRDLSEVDNCIMASAQADTAPDYLTAAVMHRLPAMPPAGRPRLRRLSLAAGAAVLCMQVAGIAGAYWWGFTRGSSQLPQGGMVHMGGSNTPAPTPAPAGSVAPVGIGVRRGVFAAPGDRYPLDTSRYTPQGREKAVRFQPNLWPGLAPGQPALGGAR
jgi:predicted anti-sigma-YlaC factor YlaD